MNANKPVRIRVMWPDAKGRLRWRNAWRVGANPPQATRKLAINCATP